MKSANITSGSHFKKIFRHGSLYMLGSFLIKGGNFLLLPIYTHVLTPEQYGVFSNIIAIGAIAGIFISLYLDSAYARLYFDHEEDPVKLRQLFSTLFLFLLAWGPPATLGLIWLIRHQSSELLGVPWYPYIFLGMLIPLVMQMNSLAGIHFRSRHQSTLVTGAQACGFVFGAAVALSLLFFANLGALALIWGVLARSCFIWVWYYFIIWRMGLIGWTFSLSNLKESLAFSLAMLPIAAMSWLSGAADKLLITKFDSLAHSGDYSIAFEIGRVMNLFVMSLFMVYSPMIFAMLKEGRDKYILRIEQFQRFYIHVLIGMALFISMFTPELFRLFIDEKFHAGMAVVPIIAVSFIFSGLRKLYATLIYYHKLIWLISLGSVIQVALSFGLNIWLIPKLGWQVAAWAKLVSMFGIAIYFYLLSLRYEPLRFDFKAQGVTLTVLISCLGLWGICVYMLHLSFWPLFLAKVLIAVLAIVATWFSSYGGEMRRVLLRRQAAQKTQSEPPHETDEQIAESQEEQ